MSHYCLLCLRTLPRRWWHRLLPPDPVCKGHRAVGCRELLDAQAAGTQHAT